MNLQDKIALVTGASRGIGKAIALELAKQGAIIIGTATTSTGAEAITETFKKHNYKGAGFALDVTKKESIEALLDTVREKFGSPLILVNNAGITRDNLLLRMKEDEWDDIINTNLSSVFRVSKACLKDMLKARWGRIINISSVVGSMGNPGQANYAAAKAGISGFSKSMAAEIASRNITVNVVAPGFIDTQMTQVLPEEQKQALLERIPAGRLGEPEDIAALVAFLASPGAGYITGQTIHVNGGMYMT